MKMIFTNNAMLMHIEQLQNFLERDDIIGYAAARNIRHLTDASLEYRQKHDEVIAKYGKELCDENGNSTGHLYVAPDNPNFQKCNDILGPLAMIEHEVDIYQIASNDVIGKLSGQEILAIDWMIKED